MIGASAHLRLVRTGTQVRVAAITAGVARSFLSVTERAVCVIGAGLIGGSLLRAAEKAGRTVWGTAASEATAAEARADGFDVTTDTDAALRRAAEADALVVLAVPLPALPAVLAPGRRGGADRAADRRREREGGGGRRGGPVRPAGAVRRRASDGGHVGVGVGGRVGGPVRGRGVGGGRRRRARPRRLARRRRAGLGVRGPGGARRRRRARPRRGPHLAPPAPVRGGAGGGGRGRADELALSLAAGSFADGTRVAGTRPELVLAMCEGNRDALLAAVDDALGRLGAMRGALASTGGLAATVRAGHDGRTRWAAAREPAGVRVRLSGRAAAGAAARRRRAGRPSPAGPDRTARSAAAAVDRAACRKSRLAVLKMTDDSLLARSRTGNGTAAPVRWVGSAAAGWGVTRVATPSGRSRSRRGRRRSSAVPSSELSSMRAPSSVDGAAVGPLHHRRLQVGQRDVHHRQRVLARLAVQVRAAGRAARRT